MKSPRTNPVQEPDLAHALMQAGYSKLILAAGQAESHRLWDLHGERAFDSLTSDPAAASHARLLAAEVLYLHGVTPQCPTHELAAVYAQVLGDPALEIANPWGTPGHHEVLSRRLVAWRDTASLKPLLTNGALLNYIGSREATAANVYRYRVKDMAASIICAIIGRSYEFQQAATERDKWIAGEAW